MVREIIAVPGRLEGDVVEVADVSVTRDERLVRAEGGRRTRSGLLGRGLTWARC